MDNTFDNVTNILLTDRLDFREGGSLDGPMLTQTLFRLRSVEAEIASMFGSSGSGGTTDTSLLTFFFPTSQPLLSSAMNMSVITFNASYYGIPDTPGSLFTYSFQSSEWDSKPVGSIFRFGNATQRTLVRINTVGGVNSSTLLRLVPGEYARLVKLSSTTYFPLSEL